MLATDSHVPCHPCFNQSQGRCTCSWHDKLSNVAAAACLCAGQSMLGVLSDCYARRTGCTQRCHHQSPNTRRADKSLRIETCTEGPLELRPGGSYPLGVPFGVSLFWEQQSQSCDNMAWGRAGAVRFKASHIPYPRSRQRLSQYLNRRPSRGLNRSLDPHLYHPPCPRRACLQTNGPQAWRTPHAFGWGQNSSRCASPLSGSPLSLCLPPLQCAAHQSYSSLLVAIVC